MLATRLIHSCAKRRTRRGGGGGGEGRPRVKKTRDRIYRREPCRVK